MTDVSTTYLQSQSDSEDDYRTGCRNVSLCQRQQSYIQDYIHPDDQTQPTFEVKIFLYDQKLSEDISITELFLCI